MKREYRHSQELIKKLLLLKSLSYTIPILGIAICAIVGGMYDLNLEIPLALMCLLLCGTFLDSGKVSNLTWDDDCLVFSQIGKQKNIVKNWSDVADFKQYMASKKAFGIIPIFRVRVIAFDFGRNFKERYELCWNVADNFEGLTSALNEKFTCVLDEKYKDFDLHEAKEFFRQKMWISNAKLHFGPSFTVPVERLRAVHVKESGATKLVYRYQDGREKTYVTLDPLKFERTFVLRYLINRQWSIAQNSSDTKQEE